MSAVSERSLAMTGHDLYLFREGTHSRLYEKLGAHGEAGATQFSVWAPNAASVSVVGDFNGWDPHGHPMAQSGDASGIWSAQVRDAKPGEPLLRKAENAPPVLALCNFTPLPRMNYHLGVPCGGYWRELLNSDAPLYGGSGVGNFGGVDAAAEPYDGQSHSLSVTLPPLGAVFFQPA